MRKENSKHKREALWTSKNMHRLPPVAWEVKLSQPASPDRIYYKQFAKHQISRLLQCKHQRFAYKITDTGMASKPFDGFTVEKSPSWCVLVYGKNAYAVDIDAFYNFCMREGNVSVKEPDAQRLGHSI
jgi:hypothetical protein